MILQSQDDKYRREGSIKLNRLWHIGVCSKVVNIVTIVYYIRLESAMIGLDVLDVVVCILYVNRVKISIYIF